MPAPVVDVLVLGATGAWLSYLFLVICVDHVAIGFTGKLITRYLLAHRERDSFTFAIAGRSKTKLAELVTSLELPASVQVFTVDVTKVDEVDEVVQKAKVVINTVGPYFRWSKPVVGCVLYPCIFTLALNWMTTYSACARHGIHYVDITGETPFVQDIITEFDFLATKTHSIIIPSCGFDSIPADLTAYLSAQTLAKASQGTVSVAQSRTSYRFRGGVSGGTMATVLSTLEEMPFARLKAASLPFAISPLKGVPQPKTALVYTLPDVPGQKRTYGYHLPLAGHNIATVQRTWGLLQQYSSKAIGQVKTTEDAVKPLPYGDQFTYGESARALGPISAALISFTIAVGAASLLLFPPMRWLLKQFVPKPGEGPSDEYASSNLNSRRRR